jgi:hypothetical protein
MWNDVVGREGKSFVYGIKHYDGDENELALTNQVNRAFAAGSLVSAANAGTKVIRWTRVSAAPLLTDLKGGSRFVGIDYIDFGDPLAFWPPPLAAGAGGSDAWEFEVEGGAIMNEIEAVLDGVPEDNAVVCRLGASPSYLT